jgi:hypothetical protein
MAAVACALLLQVLQGCVQLQALSAVRCSLGPKAGSAVAKLLKAKECGLRQLNLAHCCKIGAVSVHHASLAAASPSRAARMCTVGCIRKC